MSSFAQVETKRFEKGGAYRIFDANFDVSSQKILGRVYKMPRFDTAVLQKEDKDNMGEGVPFRFGKGFDVSYTLKDGHWYDIDKARVWAITFESEHAHSLNFVFNNISLPDGAKLFIINGDGTIVYGPVTSKVLPQKGHFLSDIISGAKSTILVYEPNDVRGKTSLEIVRVVHGYRDLTHSELYGNFGSSEPCNIDVACNPDFANEAKAVALVMLGDGTSLCSGSLVISSDYSFTPYFLTAFHCVDTSPSNMTISDSEKEMVNSWLLKFNYRKSSCEGSALANSITYNGASYLSGWSVSDFALVKLSDAVQGDKERFWLGWNNSELTPVSGTCLHHPCGDVMKVSVDNNNLTSSTWPGGTNNCWRADWDSGITQGGSSGGPLLDQNHHVIGQVRGKLAVDLIPSEVCDRTVTHFGKLSSSWNGGGTQYSRLKDKLDSIGTNWVSTTGSYPWEISAIYQPDDSRIFTIENLPEGFSVDWEIYDRFGMGYDSIWIPGMPTQNQCTLLSDLHDLTTVTAKVKANGVLVRKMRKKVGDDFGFFATYSQVGRTYQNHTYPDILETSFQDGDTIWVNMTCDVTLKSSHFKSMDFVMSGTNNYIWNNNGEGTINVVFPYNSNPSVLHVHAHNGIYKNYDFTIIAHPSSNPIMPDNPEMAIELLGNSNSFIEKNENRNRHETKL